MKNYKEAEKMFTEVLDGNVDGDVPQYYLCAWKFGLALTIRRQLNFHNLHMENIDSVDLLKGRCNLALQLFLDIIEMEGENLEKHKAMSYVQVGDIFNSFKYKKDFFQKELLQKFPGFNIYKKIQYCFEEGLRIQPEHVFVIERCAKYYRLLKTEESIDYSIELCKRAISVRETSTSHHYLALALRFKLDGSKYEQTRNPQTARLRHVQPRGKMDEDMQTRSKLDPRTVPIDTSLESVVHNFEDKTKPPHVRNIQNEIDSCMQSVSPTEELKEKDQGRRLDSGIFSMEEQCEPSECDVFEIENGSEFNKPVECRHFTTEAIFQTTSGATNKEEIDQFSNDLQQLTIRDTEGKSSDMTPEVTTGSYRGHAFRDHKGSGRQSQRNDKSSNTRKHNRQGNHQNRYNDQQFYYQYGCDSYSPRTYNQYEHYYNQCGQYYNQHGQYYGQYGQWYPMYNDMRGRSHNRMRNRSNWTARQNRYNGHVKGSQHRESQHHSSSMVTPEKIVLSRMIKSPHKVRPLPRDKIRDIITHLDRAVELNENIGALYDKGLVKRAAGLYEEAVDVFRSMFHNSRCSLVSLANAYEQAALCLNDKCAENKTSTEIVDIDMKEYLLKSIEITCNLITKLPQLKHCWKSFPTLKTLLEEKPHNKHNLRELGQLHHKVRNYSEAIGWFKQALEVETDDKRKACTHMNIVTNSLEMGNYDEAILNIDMVLCFPDGRSKVEEDLYFKAHIEGGLKAFANEELEVARIRLKNALNYKTHEENADYSDTNDNELEDNINPKQFDIFILCDQNIEPQGRKVLDQLCSLGLDVTLNDDYARADKTVMEGIAEVIDSSRHYLIILGENMESMKSVKLYTNIIQRTQEDHGFGNTVVVVENDKVKVDRMFKGFPSIRHDKIFSSDDKITLELKQLLLLLASGGQSPPFQ